MPLDPSSFRLSYLQQTDYSNSEQLLIWLQTAKQTIEENEMAISQLLAEQQNLINEITELKNKTALRDDEIEKEHQEFLKLIHQLEKKEQESEELTKINQFLEQELTDLKKKVQQQEQKIHQTSQDNQKKTQLLTNLKETLSQKNEEINDLHQRLKSLTTKQRQSRINLQTLENNWTQTLNQQEQQDVQVQKYQAQIQHLKEKNQKLSQEQKQLLSELQQVPKNQANSEKIIKEQEQKLTKLQTKLNLREEELENLVQELKEKGVNDPLLGYKTLKTEIEESKKDYQFLAQSYEKSLANLNAELVQLKQEKLEQEKLNNQQNNVESNDKEGYGKYIAKLGGWSVVIGGVLYFLYLVAKKSLGL